MIHLTREWVEENPKGFEAIKAHLVAIAEILGTGVNTEKDFSTGALRIHVNNIKREPVGLVYEDKS